jgi:hypothetical protein
MLMEENVAAEMQLLWRTQQTFYGPCDKKAL